jgi:hypothetical protein
MASKKKASPKRATTRGAAAAAKANADTAASLAKRVAEAASGLRNGRRVWFVVNSDFPHGLTNHYSEREADDALTAKGSAFTKMGPFMTPDEVPHKKQLEWIKVKVKGRAKEMHFNPEEADALFWSLSALDKFFYPYYTMLYGPQKAAEMRKKYTDPSNTNAVVCHEPLSDECNDEI